MRTLLSALLVFTVVGVGACSSSDSTTPAATGGSGGAATGGSSGAATGGSSGAATGGSAGATGGAAGNPGDAGAGKCANASDQTAVTTGKYGDAGIGVADVAAVCGKGCLTSGAADVEACTTTCVVTETGGAVSEPCASCFSGSVKCTIENCLADCLADSTAPACTTCRCGKKANQPINCIDVFSACSGLPSSTCN